MFENPRRGRQARNFTTNVLKILDLKSSSEQIFSKNCRWVPLLSQFQTISSHWFANIHQRWFHSTSLLCLYRVCIKTSHSQTIATCNQIESDRDQQRCWMPLLRLVHTGASYDLAHGNLCNPRNRMWCFFQLILLSFSLTAIILIHEKFCNLIGLEPWYFSFVWNTYIWKLQTVCR